MGPFVVAVLVLAVGASTAYCLARCLVPRWRAGHGVAVDAWHVAMGVAMVAMLLAPVGRDAAALQATAFAIAALWCACHLLARNRSGAHARLGVACAVMAAMLMPAVAAAPAAASAGGVAQPHHHVPGMDMTAVSTGAVPSSGGHHAMAMPPGWLAIAMLVAVVVIAVAAVRELRATPSRPLTARLSLGSEVVMAGSMGFMAALAL